MKNLVFNLALALVVIAYIGGISFELKKEVKDSGNNKKIVLPSTSPVLAEEKFAVGTASNSSKYKESLQNKVEIPSMRIGRITTVNSETRKADFPEILFPYSTSKTIDEIIAEDNAITGNNPSDENGMDVVNANLSIDTIVFDKSGKTIDEIIAEDNAIIGNNYTSEVQAANLITENTLYTITIDEVVFNKEGKTIDEIIAEDNAITGNNESNEIAALDFK